MALYIFHSNRIQAACDWKKQVCSVDRADVQNWIGII